MSNKHLLCLTAAGFLVTSAVQAHSLMPAEASWFTGLLHPLLGLDHLLVTLAVGLWASQQRKCLWYITGVFLALMLFGAILGGAAAALPLVETAIAASVVAMGLMLWFAIRLPTMPGMLMVGLFALFHGYAHGAEMPPSPEQMIYFMGLMLSTAALLGMGIGTGLLANGMRRENLLRLGGFAIGLTGAWLWI